MANESTSPSNLASLPGKLQTAYSVASPAALLGRAWHLCRHYPKESFLGILPAFVLMCIQSFLMVVVNLLATSSKAGALGSITGALLIFGIGFLMVGVGFLKMGSWVFCNCVLSRFYCSAMMFEAPLSIKSCYRYVGRIWPLLIAYIGPWILLLIIYTIIDILFLVAAGFIGAFLIALSKSIVSIPWVAVGFFIILFLLGTILLIILWALISAQMLTLHLPMVILANADYYAGEISETKQQLSWLDTYGLSLEQIKEKKSAPFDLRPAWMSFMKIWTQSFTQIIRNPSKALIFGAIWFFFILVWFMVWNFPLTVWLGVEAFFEKLQPGSEHAQLKLLAENIIQVWTTFVTVMILPFYVSGSTVFWYDSSISQEGLDLRIWLAQLRSRWLSKQKKSAG